jgi:REDY-like protein HapK
VPVRFYICTLKPGVDPAEYEEWLIEHDREFARSHPNFRSYNVHRVSGQIQGSEAYGWQYVERIEVESLEQHERDLASPLGKAIIDELERRFVEPSKTITFVCDIIA